MNQDKIIQALLNTLSVDDLQAMVDEKKSQSQPARPEPMSYEEKYMYDFEKWFLSEHKKRTKQKAR